MKKKKFKVRGAIKNSDDYAYFSLALKRFNLGIEEEDFEEKIIDFIIAFEALCLPELDELRYRLSNRIATLVSKNSEEAEKIRDFMKKAYDVRSSIVHGGKIKSIAIEGKPIKLGVFTKKLEDYLRKTLRLFLTLSVKVKKQKDLIELLDKSLFDLQTKRFIRSLAKQVWFNRVPAFDHELK